jgi:two-component system response regulator FixJ
MVLEAMQTMSQTRSIHAGNVYAVDDDPAVTKLVKAVLEASGFRVTTFNSAEDFLSNVEETSNACLILDIGMPTMNGTALQAEMRARGMEIPIVFLSAIANIPIATQLMKRGAMNVLEKPFADADLIQAVTEAVDAAVSMEDRNRALGGVRSRLAQLTSREMQILHLLAKGLLNKQIGLALDLSERTVEIHRARIMSKMQADSIALLMRQYAAAFPSLESTVPQAA